MPERHTVQKRQGLLLPGVDPLRALPEHAFVGEHGYPERVDADAENILVECIATGDLEDAPAPPEQTNGHDEDWEYRFRASPASLVDDHPPYHSPANDWLADQQQHSHGDRTITFYATREMALDLERAAVTTFLYHESDGRFCYRRPENITPQI